MSTSTDTGDLNMTTSNTIQNLLLSIGGLALGASLGACDLDMKDLGDETETAGDDGATPGGQCEPGDQMMADDGCNTCSCGDDGVWACTELGCDPTQGPGDDGGDAGDDGGQCQPGDEMPSSDGCNTCSCDETGNWACTDIACGETEGGECTPGDMMPADDGCNTCTCGDDGIWACTLLGCDPEPMVDVCEPLDPGFAAVMGASITGDNLLVSVAYAGGCEPQFFGACWDGAFAESDPVQVWVALSHTGLPDPCDGIVQEDLSYSLTDMRAAYEAGYQTATGTITIHLDGWAESLTYAW